MSTYINLDDIKGQVITDLEAKFPDITQSFENPGHSYEEKQAFRRHFIKPDGTLDSTKLDSFQKIYHVEKFVESSDAVIKSRVENTDEKTAFETLESNIHLMHEAGLSLEASQNIINKYIKLSKSFTPHPTEGLSPEGIAMVRELFEAAESNASNRNDAVEAIIRKMLKSDEFAAWEKSNILDETDASNTLARIHNKGVNQLDRKLEDYFEASYGERPEIHTNSAARSWDFDADGKNNAEAFAMMAKLAATTNGAFEDWRDNMKAALEDDDLTQEQRESIQIMYDDAVKLIARLKPSLDKSRKITKALAEAKDSAERQALYTKYYDQYDDLLEDFAGIYDAVDDQKTRGLNYWKDTVHDLNLLRKETDNWNLDESFRTLQRCGFALEKGQTRHNDLIYQEIMDNVFNDDAIWGLGILSAHYRQKVRREGGFSNLTDAEQSEIWEILKRYSKENGNLKDIQNIMLEDNPLKFNKNGYPSQERTLLDRMILQAKYRYKFEEMIISDAQSNASDRQDFIAYMCGIFDGKSMPLHEDYDNLAQQAMLTKQFGKHGGADNLQRRIEKLGLKVEMGTGYFGFHVMRPASDAEKNGGPGTRMQAFKQYRALARLVAETGIPIQVMIGGGLSNNRFGGDVAMVQRAMEQEIAEIVAERGTPLDPKNSHDEALLRTQSSVMYTEQGRAKRIYSATSHQVSDDFAWKISNIIPSLLETMGLLQPGSVIDPKPKLSEKITKLHRELTNDMIDEFRAFRFIKEKKADGNILALDSVADFVRPVHMMEFMNNGARPASKSGSKVQSEARAIENDESHYAAESFIGGSYSSGRLMEILHSKLHAKELEMSDINDFLDHPEWDYAVMSRNLSDAARFNASQVFGRLGTPTDGRAWTFDTLVELGKSVTMQKDMDNHSKKHDVLYDMEYDDMGGTITQEQAYMAKMYYDRLQFLASTEAILNKSGQGVTMNDDMDKIVNSFRPADNGIEIDLGTETAKKWPVAKDVQEKHRRNNAGSAMLFQVNDYIEEQIQTRAPEESIEEAKTRIISQIGDDVKSGGGYKAGERFLRNVAASYREGTMPHDAFWAASLPSNDNEKTCNFGMKTRHGNVKNSINLRDYLTDTAKDMKRALDNFQLMPKKDAAPVLA